MTNMTAQLVNAEEIRAELMHGRLTEDRCRAFTILSEEHGEVAKAILELTRVNRIPLGPDRYDAARKAAKHAKDELIQLMAMASLLVDQMDDVIAS